MSEASDDAAKATAKTLVEDLFEHERFSRRLVTYLEEFQGGKVVSLRAPWGRGKTDVLLRAHEIARSRKTDPESPIAAVIWVNPWQYGRANLLMPLLDALLPLIPPARLTADREKIKEILISMIGVTSGVMLKSAGFEAISNLAEQLLKGLIDAKTKSPYSPDPVAPLGKAFKDILETYITTQENPKKSQVLIFVDDLDRCLPERQISLLEAFHFLVDAGANATFVMAIDGEILAASAKSRYHSEAFDANRYLDKIFDFNIELPTLSTDQMRSFVGKVNHIVGEVGSSRSCQLPSDFSTALLSVLGFHWKFRNPRNLTRFLAKLIAYVGSGNELPHGSTELTFFWLLVFQTWPEARFQLVGVVERGPKVRAGAQEEMALRAFMEHLQSATAEPFTLLTFSQPLHLGPGYAWKAVLESFHQVVKALNSQSM